MSEGRSNFGHASGGTASGGAASGGGSNATCSEEIRQTLRDKLMKKGRDKAAVQQSNDSGIDLAAGQPIATRQMSQPMPGEVHHAAVFQAPMTNGARPTQHVWMQAAPQYNTQYTVPAAGAPIRHIAAAPGQQVVYAQPVPGGVPMFVQQPQVHQVQTQPGAKTQLVRTVSEPSLPHNKHRRFKHHDRGSPLPNRRREPRGKMTPSDITYQNQQRDRLRRKGSTESYGSTCDSEDIDDQEETESVHTVHSSTSQRSGQLLPQYHVQQQHTLQQQQISMVPTVAAHMLHPGQQHIGVQRQTSLPPAIQLQQPQVMMATAGGQQVYIVPAPAAPQAVLAAQHIPLQAAISAPAGAPMMAATQEQMAALAIQQHQPPQQLRAAHAPVHATLSARSNESQPMHRPLEESVSCPPGVTTQEHPGYVPHPVAGVSTSGQTAPGTRSGHQKLTRIHKGVSRVAGNVVHRDLNDSLAANGGEPQQQQRHGHRPLGQSASAEAQLVGDHRTKSLQRASPPPRASPLPSLQEHQPMDEDSPNVERAPSIGSAVGSYQAAKRNAGGSLLPSHEPIQRAYSEPGTQQAQQAYNHVQFQMTRELAEKQRQAEHTYNREQVTLDQMARQLEQQHLSDMVVLQNARQHIEHKREETKMQIIRQAQAAQTFTQQPGTAPHIVAVPHGMVAAPTMPVHAPVEASLSGSAHSLPRSSLSREPTSPNSATLSPPPTSAQTERDPAATCIIYDSIMLKHACTCNSKIHIEHPGRVQSIYSRLTQTGMLNLCNRLKPRKASLAEIQSVHSENHAFLFGGNGKNRKQQVHAKCFEELACGGLGVDQDTVWHETYTAPAARMAAGCVTELALRVADNYCKNGFALVRPPGHHAEAQRAMAFCYFNNVAIAAAQLLQQRLASRILIFDWSVHHGQATQSAFFDSQHVLYISMHRYDNGHFFPGTGGVRECGSGVGLGYTVNIPFSGGDDPPIGDLEYVHAFRSIVLPISKEFKPDIVLVSAGFDAMDGHDSRIGGYKVSAACFAYMTQQLMKITPVPGKVVLALEGGYDLKNICDASEACVRALLDIDAPILDHSVFENVVNPNVSRAIEESATAMSPYWECMSRENRSRLHDEDEAAQALGDLALSTGRPAMQQQVAHQHDNGEEPGEDVNPGESSV